VSGEAGARERAIVAYVTAVWPRLDELTYYDLLDVPRDVDPIALQQAFYLRAAQLHPDRYFRLSDPDARARLATIYARVTEAYRVLSDKITRAAYDRGLALGRARYDPAAERRGPVNPEEAVEMIQTKRFLRLALAAQRVGDWKTAVMNLRFALSLEPRNAYLQEQLAAAEAKVGAKR
jgi:curved DNA-binding protein CbpA